MGSWIKAALFYVENCTKYVNDVVEILEIDSGAVEKVQKLIKNPQMASDLTFMLAQFKNIPAIIEKLETRNMSLTSQ